MQVACVNTDADGLWNIGITVGFTAKINVTMTGGERPDQELS